MIKPQDPISDDAMAKLAKLMNDSPTLVKLKGTEWEIHSLKPGVQWIIAEEACKIVAKENASMGDVIKEFASNVPSVCKVITCALLNDKRVLNQECGDFQRLYDSLMWGDYDMKDWVTLLFEILQLIDVDFFFASTSAIATVRQMTLKRKTTIKEQKSSIAVPNGGK